MNALSAVHQLGDRREMVVFLRRHSDTTKQDVERRLALVARDHFRRKDEAWDENGEELAAMSFCAP